METIISFNTFVPIYIQKNESLTRITTPLINANNEFKMDDALPPEEWRVKVSRVYKGPGGGKYYTTRKQGHETKHYIK